MAWVGLPLAAGDGWQEIAFFNQFLNAVRERHLVGGRSLNNQKYLTDLVAGDTQDLQDSLLYAEMQETLELIALAFIRVANFDIDDVDPLTETDFWTAANANTWFYDWTQVKVEAGLNVAGWERQYPREIDDVADAGSNGQVARHTVDTLIYEHNGTTWLEAVDQSQPPDRITDHGQMEAGDYIDAHIFNELRAVCDVYTHLFYAEENADDNPAGLTGRFGNNSIAFKRKNLPNRTKGGTGDTTLLLDFANAQALAEADFQLGADIFGSYACVASQFSRTSFGTQADTHTSAFDVSIASPVGSKDWLDGVDADVDIYVWPHARDLFGATTAYDDHGYTLTEEAWNTLRSVTQTYDSDSHLELLGVDALLDTLPTWPVDPVSNNETSASGFECFKDNTGGPALGSTLCALVEPDFTQ